MTRPIWTEELEIRAAKLRHDYKMTYAKIGETLGGFNAEQVRSVLRRLEGDRTPTALSAQREAYFKNLKPLRDRAAEFDLAKHRANDQRLVVELVRAGGFPVLSERFSAKGERVACLPLIPFRARAA